MAPTDSTRSTFRWEFVPVEARRDKAIHWTWRAWNHAGELVMEANRTFESREDCVEDAIRRGHRPAG